MVTPSAAARLSSRRVLPLLAAVMIGAAGPDPAPPAPTPANCAAAIAKARTAVGTLPRGTMSRKFAQFDLVQAAAEAGNGEYDDCLEYAGSALDEVLHPHHQGESTAPARQSPK